MPIDDTPVEHVVVALATTCTGDEMDAPVEGENTETEARAGIAASAMQHSRIFICNSSLFV